MRLVDSSVWIEWLMDTPLGAQLSKWFPPPEQWIVPTIVQYEVFMWLARQVSTDAAGAFLSHTQLCLVVDLDKVIAIRAAELSNHESLSAGDAIIYATAMEFGADLLTCDAHFQGLDGVDYVAKSNA